MSIHQDYKSIADHPEAGIGVSILMTAGSAIVAAIFLNACALFTEPVAWTVKPDPDYQRSGDWVLTDGVYVMESADPNTTCLLELGYLPPTGRKALGCAGNVGDLWFIVVPYNTSPEARRTIAHEWQHTQGMVHR